ncbi:MAG: CBS domain-containing protein [Candidatus Heimdallarchaeota archaeon]|nr:CBS domain-containing protein [Candidatus Heimdallarchaeota archaeon]
MFDMAKLFQELRKRKAADFKLRKITPIYDDQTLLEIFNRIGTSDLPIIPVINKKGQYIGIITLRDLLFLFQKKHTSLHEAFSHQHVFTKYTAGELININLPVIYDNDSLERVMECMSKYQSSVLPRARDQKEQITGLIYLADIFTEIRNIIRKLVAERETEEQMEECEPEK